jgi:hypothetical protein
VLFHGDASLRQLLSHHLDRLATIAGWVVAALADDLLEQLYHFSRLNLAKDFSLERGQVIVREGRDEHRHTKASLLIE